MAAPSREELAAFVRDVARSAPKPSDSLEYSRGILSTLSRRAGELSALDHVDALSSLAMVPAPRDAA